MSKLHPHKGWPAPWSQCHDVIILHVAKISRRLIAGGCDATRRRNTAAKDAPHLGKEVHGAVCIIHAVVRVCMCAPVCPLMWFSHQMQRVCHEPSPNCAVASALPSCLLPARWGPAQRPDLQDGACWYLHWPRKTTLQPALLPSARTSFAASPIDTARPQENQWPETRHVGASERAFRARLPPIFTICSFKIGVFLRVSYEPLNLLPQNRCFVRGFRQFSSHLTKCPACHGICTLWPLDAALTLRFAKNTHHDTSKVLRLPREMTMEVAKVLRLPRKLQLIFWKRCKSIAPAKQNDFWHVMKESGTPPGPKNTWF